MTSIPRGASHIRIGASRLTQSNANTFVRTRAHGLFPYVTRLPQVLLQSDHPPCPRTARACIRLARIVGIRFQLFPHILPSLPPSLVWVETPTEKSKANGFPSLSNVSVVYFPAQQQQKQQPTSQDNESFEIPSTAGVRTNHVGSNIDNFQELSRDQELLIDKCTIDNYVRSKMSLDDLHGTRGPLSQLSSRRNGWLWQFQGVEHKKGLAALTL